MNRKGFFVSLTSLLILIVLISLVLVDQTLSRERAEGEWDETRKELVSELVFDLENAMIPNAISSSVKNRLVSNSPYTITVDTLKNEVNNNLSDLSIKIRSIFTIPLEAITITITSLDIQQTGPFTLEVTAIVEYVVESEGDSWNNTVEYENLPISVIGMVHPAYPDNGAITPEFWNVHWEDCLLKHLIPTQTCDPLHGICPILLEWCDTYNPPISEEPVEP